MNQIKEAFVITTQDSTKLVRFIKDAKFKGIKIYPLLIEDANNPGDVLRELESMRKIKKDFILIRGDVLTNIDLAPAIAAHMQRKNDKKIPSVCTKIFARLPHNDPLRSESDSIAIVSERATSKIVKYQNLNSAKDTLMQLIGVKLKYGRDTQFEIATDLVDCEIDICSPEILRHFSDSFSDKSLKDEFINNLIESEIISDEVYMYEVPDSAYFSRIRSPKAYSQTTKDVLMR